MSTIAYFFEKITKLWYKSTKVLMMEESMLDQLLSALVNGLFFMALSCFILIMPMRAVNGANRLLQNSVSVICGMLLIVFFALGAHHGWEKQRGVENYPPNLFFLFYTIRSGSISIRIDGGRVRRRFMRFSSGQAVCEILTRPYRLMPFFTNCGAV